MDSVQIAAIHEKIFRVRSGWTMFGLELIVVLVDIGLVAARS